MYKIKKKIIVSCYTLDKYYSFNNIRIISYWSVSSVLINHRLAE